MFSSLFVCVLATMQKNFRMDLHEIITKGWQWANEQVIKFQWQSGSPDFQIRHYWEIWTVVNGHKYAAHTDSPDGSTGKTCPGGSMHCPSASSF